MSTVDADTALEILSHESIVRQTYKDSEGVWTWSAGLTKATGHDVTRYIGKPQTLEHCIAIYAWALEKYAREVDEAFGGHLLTKAQFAAALSFHWNTGAIKTATWVKLWKAGPGWSTDGYADARKSFMAWNKPAEIIGRRTKECALFFDGKWSNNGTVTEYTRVKANGTPDWSSAKRIDVTKAFAAVFGPKLPPDVEPIDPKPSAPVQVVALVSALLAAVAALATYLGVSAEALKGMLP